MEHEYNKEIIRSWLFKSVISVQIFPDETDTLLYLLFFLFSVTNISSYLINKHIIQLSLSFIKKHIFEPESMEHGGIIVGRRQHKRRIVT